LAADLSSHTATGSTVGTPHFMAPEQASGGEVTTATDVFALGQTAAFAALGRPLYGEGPAVSVLYRIVHDEPDLSVLPEPLRPLFARCLAAAPEERATLTEVVEWCRRRLGADADAGAGPTVWRDVMGPEVTVPSPVPDPTRMLHTRPLVVTQPQQTRPDGRPVRRRRTALITAAAMMAGALVLTGFVWMVSEVGGRFRDWVAGVPATSGPEESEGSSGDGSGSSSASAPTSGDGADSSGTGDRAPGASQPSPTVSESPQVLTQAPVLLNAQTSLSFEEPLWREDRKGDIRLKCKADGCELESENSVFLQLFGKSGATLDECRLLLTDADRHSWTLASVAAGTEICVKHPSGDIALLVVQTKSTALPELGFLSLDMTVWKNAA
ncbi:serine/threonine protein kinase, partial [Streptomyces sp. NPDC006356]